jgi:hypothetical protein
MCKDCGGGSICVHGNVKSYCKVCRKLGSAISGMATTMMTTMMVQGGGIFSGRWCETLYETTTTTTTTITTKI